MEPKRSHPSSPLSANIPLVLIAKLHGNVAVTSVEQELSTQELRDDTRGGTPHTPTRASGPPLGKYCDQYDSEMDAGGLHSCK